MLGEVRLGSLRRRSTPPVDLAQERSDATSAPLTSRHRRGAERSDVTSAVLTSRHRRGEERSGLEAARYVCPGPVGGSGLFGIYAFSNTKCSKKKECCRHQTESLDGSARGQTARRQRSADGRRQCRDSNGPETETLRHAPEGMHARTPRIARTSGPLDRTQDCVLVELGVHSPISIHPIVSVCRCSYARYVSVCSLLACMMQGCLDVSGATPRGGVSPNDVSRDIVGPGGDDGLRPSKDGERRKLVRATRLDEGSGDGAGVSRDEGQSLGSL